MRLNLKSLLVLFSMLVLFSCKTHENRKPVSESDTGSNPTEYSKDDDSIIPPNPENTSVVVIQPNNPNTETTGNKDAEDSKTPANTNNNTPTGTSPGNGTTDTAKNKDGWSTGEIVGVTVGSTALTIAFIVSGIFIKKKYFSDQTPPPVPPKTNTPVKKGGTVTPKAPEDLSKRAGEVEAPRPDNQAELEAGGGAPREGDAGGALRDEGDAGGAPREERDVGGEPVHPEQAVLIKYVDNDKPGVRFAINLPHGPKLPLLEIKEDAIIDTLPVGDQRFIQIAEGSSLRDLYSNQAEKGITKEFDFDTEATTRTIYKHGNNYYLLESQVPGDRSMQNMGVLSPLQKSTAEERAAAAQNTKFIFTGPGESTYFGYAEGKNFISTFVKSETNPNIHIMDINTVDFYRDGLCRVRYQDGNLEKSMTLHVKRSNHIDTDLKEVYSKYEFTTGNVTSKIAGLDKALPPEGVTRLLKGEGQDPIEILRNLGQNTTKDLTDKTFWFQYEGKAYIAGIGAGGVAVSVLKKVEATADKIDQGISFAPAYGKEMKQYFSVNFLEPGRQLYIPLPPKGQKIPPALGQSSVSQAREIEFYITTGRTAKGKPQFARSGNLYLKKKAYFERDLVVGPDGNLYYQYNIAEMAQ